MEQTAYKVGLYWNKSYWNGFSSVPVIVSIHDGRISFTSPDGVIVDQPITKVRAHLTSWGSLALTIDGKKYRMTTTGATVSRSFSKEQVDELIHNDNLKALKTIEEGGFALGLPLSHAGGAAGIAGVAGETIAVASKLSSYYGKKDMLEQLCDILEALKVPMVRRKQALVRNILLFYAVLFVVLVVVISIVNSITGSRS